VLLFCGAPVLLFAETHWHDNLAEWQPCGALLLFPIPHAAGRI
jgi:hypothetical protein